MNRTHGQAAVVDGHPTRGGTSASPGTGRDRATRRAPHDTKEVRLQGPGLSIEFSPAVRGWGLSVAAFGRFDARTLPLLPGMLATAAHSGRQHTTLDLTHIVVPSPDGLDILAGLQRSYHAAGGQLVVENVRPHAIRWLRAAGVDMNLPATHADRQRRDRVVQGQVAVGDTHPPLVGR